jgi:hypothetical protein
MHALVRFAHVAAGSTFTTAEIHPYVLKALGSSISDYSLASLRYDLYKLRAKNLVEKAASLPTLPITARRVFSVSHLPQAHRAYLRTTHRRTAVPALR